MSHNDVSSVDKLTTYITAGWEPEYVFFWGHQPISYQPIGKWCLSQWFPAPFVVEKIDKALGFFIQVM